MTTALPLLIWFTLQVQTAHDHSLSSEPTLWAGIGEHDHKVDTLPPAAQRYFNQGMALYYGFNYEEAILLFREVIRLAPNASMGYWGIALSLAPNLNNPIISPQQESNALAYCRQGLQLARSQAERAHLEALDGFYRTARALPLSRRLEKYARDLEKIAAAHIEDPDALPIAAGMLLTINPWDHWTEAGEARPATSRAVELLELVLSKNPSHIGANHFLVHALEASPFPQRALPAAQRLAKLAPAAGHLVHMASHIYLRTGPYADAVDANHQAIAADSQYLARRGRQGNYALMFHPHNVYFLWFALCMEGRSGEAARAARTLMDSFPQAMVREHPMLEFFTPIPLYTMLRFGKWNLILDSPKPDSSLHYLNVIWRYARGVAFVSLGDLKSAQVELVYLRVARKELLAIPAASPYVRQVSELAELVLDARIAAEMGQNAGFKDLMKKAITGHDRLPYTEPPAWYESVRYRMGRLLLKRKEYAEAEILFQEDLRRNPANGWSLYGRSAAALGQGDVNRAEVFRKQFSTAWARADFDLQTDSN